MRADAQGAFRIARVAEGRVELMVVPRGSRPDDPGLAIVEVEAGATGVVLEER